MEILERDQVRSSIARRLGLDIGALAATDRHVEGVVEMMLDATQGYDRPLTQERLFAWHASLFPTGRSGLDKIEFGTWRDDRTGPMQVVSGPIHKRKVHFEAPAASLIPAEIAAFVFWFETTADIDPVLRAGLAHLWFVTIHPFEDGNGRIARAIGDMALARSEASPLRFYSMSAQIRLERNDYYLALERAQKGTLDVTEWLEWFLGCLSRAVNGASATLDGVLQKARFWQKHAGESINHRQRNILNLLLDDFEGRLTSSKWARIAKCSQDTASRDIDVLIDRGILVRSAVGGGSTHYELVLPGLPASFFSRTANCAGGIRACRSGDPPLSGRNTWPGCALPGNDRRFVNDRSHGDLQRRQDAASTFPECREFSSPVCRLRKKRLKEVVRTWQSGEHERLYRKR